MYVMWSNFCDLRLKSAGKAQCVYPVTHHVYIEIQYTWQMYLLSTGKEMTPAMNATDAHTQGFVVNDELLLRISAGIHTVHSLTTRYYELLDVFSLCAVVEQPVNPTTIAKSPLHRARHAHPPVRIICGP